MGTTRVNYSVVKLIAAVLCILIIGLNLMMISTPDNDEAKHLQRDDGDFGAAVHDTEVVNTTNRLLVTDVVFLDITIGSEDVGRIEIGLFGKDVPKTAANFKGLAEGFVDKASGKTYQFKGSKFHRTIKNFMIQGGNVCPEEGGGKSIYGGHFDDESFHVKHHGPGWLGQANAGPNTNADQFYITTADTSFLDDGYVVTGKVLKGMSVVRKIEAVPTGTDPAPDTPLTPIVVSDSGSLQVEPFWTEKSPVPDSV